MVQVLVRLKVADQAKWKEVFTGAAGLREEFGSKGVRAFALADDPNSIVIVGDYEDADRARQLFQSQEFREATQKGGVQGPPEVSTLTEILKLDA